MTKSLLILIALTLPIVASAKPTYLAEYKKVKSDPSASCTVCHMGKPMDRKFSEYGQKFKDAGHDFNKMK
ncbi:MAG: hypothetical protein A2Z97_09635 [Bdellovibrionales bacterium GWB1_52_6]|nr:MAG: hypothetical protein A2Z97_09635 [Bdellovibrionales bacterium GWB1_52_6]OFZ03656.1 MAG: hypothetical protein A2X97_01010 [Bdellovibrionales bacterium GWA1_52_35]HCM40619.1 hypothetical protein [Bdellovibrionales bacterium]